MRFAALAAVLALAACESDNFPDPAPSVSIVSGAFGLGPNAFDPNPFTRSFNAGSRVQWANNDAVVHRLVSMAPAPLFDSGDLAPGATFTFTYSARGTYAYHCSIHPTMVGTITLN